MTRKQFYYSIPDAKYFISVSKCSKNDYIFTDLKMNLKRQYSFRIMFGAQGSTILGIWNYTNSRQDELTIFYNIMTRRCFMATIPLSETKSRRNIILMDKIII